jgi:Zn ribbon nucleic-acid-binding protein
MELKPCPICGDLPEVSVYREELISLHCVWCGYHECDIDVWNNAWAHKRIAELEAILATKEDSYDK